MQYRHGDVLLERIETLPTQTRKLQHTILAHGEVTGHCHRIEGNENASLHESMGDLFLDVWGESATLVHEEHHSIVLPPGRYRVWRQREYSPQEVRIIRD